LDPVEPKEFPIQVIPEMVGLIILQAIYGFGISAHNFGIT
jgi:hypothetical protein